MPGLLLPKNPELLKAYCCDCKEEFDHVLELREHVRTMHNIDRSITYCRQCDHFFRIGEMLFDHVKNGHIIRSPEKVHFLFKVSSRLFYFEIPNGKLKSFLPFSLGFSNIYIVIDNYVFKLFHRRAEEYSQE